MNEARRLSPNYFNILSAYGCFAFMFGKAQAGVESVERAIRLNPNFPAYTVPCMRFAFAVVGRYEDVLRVQEHEPEEKMHAFGYPIVAGSLAKLGRLDEAKALVARAVAKFPGMLTLEQLVWGSPPNLQPFWEDMLRAAGFPVCADDKDVARYPNAVRLPECTKQTQ